CTGANALEDFSCRENILRRYPAVLAYRTMVALRGGPALDQFLNTRSLRTNRCGILQQVPQLRALVIVLLQQVPHTRLLTAFAFNINLRASLPDLPPGAGPERVSLSPCCHSDSKLPRSPRSNILPLPSRSASAGHVHPTLPANAPRAPALPSLR